MGQADSILNQTRNAALAWSDRPLRDRLAKIATLRRTIVEHLDEIVTAIHEDTGKLRTEAMLTDLLPVLEQMRFYEKRAARILAPQKRPGSLLFEHGRGQVFYRPYGAVLIIAPWNNPFQLSMLPAATALIGGNGVVLKPSERCPRLNALLPHLFEKAGMGGPLVQCVEGGQEVVATLVAQRPDLILFTGGPIGGKAVYRMAAEHLIPVMLELGGKDPMIIFADADLDRACSAAVYGSFAHDGQHCISTERLLVEANVYDQVLTAVARGAEGLRRRSAESSIGDLALEVDASVRERVFSQIEEACKEGARLVTAKRDQYPVLPAVVADVHPGMRIMREESFGPVVAVMPFETESQAVSLANNSDLGLNASVWTADARRADRMRAALQSGCVCINNVLVNAGFPSIPFGGMKQSGFGRYHGPEGLLAFVQPQAVFTQDAPQPRELHWFPYGNDLGEITEELIRLRFGTEKGGLIQTLGRWIRLGKKRSRRLRELKANRLLSQAPVGPRKELDGR